MQSTYKWGVERLILGKKIKEMMKFINGDIYVKYNVCCVVYKKYYVIYKKYYVIQKILKI